MKTSDQTLPEEKLVYELQVWPRSLQGGLVLLRIKLSPIWIAGGWQCPKEVNCELVNKQKALGQDLHTINISSEQATIGDR